MGKLQFGVGSALFGWGPTGAHFSTKLLTVKKHFLGAAVRFSPNPNLDWVPCAAPLPKVRITQTNPYPQTHNSFLNSLLQSALLWSRPGILPIPQSRLGSCEGAGSAIEQPGSLWLSSMQGSWARPGLSPPGQIIGTSCCPPRLLHRDFLGGGLGVGLRGYINTRKSRNLA